MSKRFRFVFILAIILLIVYYLPFLPTVRSFISEKALAAVANAGYDIGYQGELKGNLWTGFGFDDATLNTKGIDLKADKIRFRYYLAKLLIRELAITLDIDGARGEISWQDLEFSETKASLKLDLQSLNLTNSSLAFRDLPYTIPDIEIKKLNVLTENNVYKLRGLLETDLGSSTVDAVIGLEPNQISANFSDFDLRIVRHWWGGIEGGKAQGFISYLDGKISGKAQVDDGHIFLIDTDVTGITGTVNLDYPNVVLDMKGKAIDGEVVGKGCVAIEESEWSGELEAETPLKSGAIWVANNRINVDMSDWDIKGKIKTKVNLKGWQDVQVVGNALAQGSLVGREVKDLNATFIYKSSDGIRVFSTANIAGGEVVSKLAPIDGGIEFKLKADNLVWLEQTDTQIDFLFDTTEPKKTFLKAHTLIDRIGRKIEIDADTVYQNGIWLADISGGDDMGETISGKLVYDKEIKADLDLEKLQIPYFKKDAKAKLNLVGQLGALTMNSRLYHEEALDFNMQSLNINEDFAGEIKALISYENVENIEANLGPLRLSGNTSIDFQNAVYSFSLSPSKMLGMADGHLALSRGTLAITDGVIDANANLDSDFEKSGVSGSLHGFANFTKDDEIRLKFLSPEAKLSYQNSVWDVDLYGLELNAANTPFSLSGNVLLGGESNYYKLKAVSEYGDLSAFGPTEDLDISFNSENISLRGKANLQEKTLSAKGNLANLDLSLNGKYDKIIEARAIISQEQNKLYLQANGKADLQEIKLSLDGQISLQAAHEAAKSFGYFNDLKLQDFAGLLKPSIIYEDSQLSGLIDFEGTAFAYPLSIKADVAGPPDNLNIDYSGQTVIAGQNTSLSGQGYPQQTLLATSEFGQVKLERNKDNKFALVGSGKSPKYKLAKWQIEPEAWTASGDLNEVNIKLGQSNFLFKQADGRWQLCGKINQAAHEATKTLLLSSQLTASSENPDGQLNGVLQYKMADTEFEMPLSGSLKKVKISLDAAAKDVQTFFDFDYDLLGKLKADISVFPFKKDFELEGNWFSTNEAIKITAGFAKDGVWARALNNSLSAEYKARDISFDLKEFSAAGLIANYPKDYPINGRMAYSPERGWQGKLELSKALKFSEQEIPIALTAVTDNGQMNLSGKANIYGQNIDISGSLFPNFKVLAENRFGQVYLQREDNKFIVSGQGNSDGLQFSGWQLKNQDWLLDGDLRQLKLVSPNNVVNLSLENGLWTLDAQILQELRQKDKTLIIDTAFSANKDKPMGEIAGSLRLKNNQYDIAALVSGALDKAEIELEQKAAELAKVANYDLPLLGDVSLKGQANLISQSYNLSGYWLTERGRIDIELGGIQGDVWARAQNKTLVADYSSNNLSLELKAFDPSIYSTSYPSEAKVSGKLAYNPETAWSGSVNLQKTFAFNNQTIPLDVSAIAKGKQIAISGEAEALGQTIELSGELYPVLDVRADSQYGEIKLDKKEGKFALSGKGTSPELNWQNWRLDKEAWTLVGDLDALSIELGQNIIGITRKDNDWQLEAQIKQSLQSDGKETTLLADFANSNKDLNGKLQGKLIYSDKGKSTELAVEGPLDAIVIHKKSALDELLSTLDIHLGLLGEVDLKASLNLLSQEYSFNAFWITDNDEVKIEGGGKGGELWARAQGDKLRAEYSAGKLDLQLDKYLPSDSFAKAKTDMTISGTMSYDFSKKEFLGELDAATQKPVASDIKITGLGRQLLLSGRLRQSELSAQLSGVLWPSLAVSIDSELAGYGSLKGLINGQLVNPQASGQLNIRDIQFDNELKASLKAQDYSWTSSPFSGNYFSLFNKEANVLNITKDKVSGELNLPLSIEERGHSFHAVLTGNLQKPILNAEISGPVLSGPINYQEAELNSELKLDPSYWLSNLGKQLDVAVQAKVDNQAAHLQITTTVVGKEISLDTVIKGDLEASSGEGTIVIVGQEIPISFVNDLQGLELRSYLDNFDLASLNVFAPIGISGEINGELSFTQQQGLGLELKALGRIQNKDFNIAAQYHDRQLFINGESLKNRVKLEELGQGHYSLKSFSEDNDNIDLLIDVFTSDGIDMQASGSLGKNRLSINANYRPVQESGYLDLSLAELAWHADLGKTEGHWQLSSRLVDNSGFFLASPLENRLLISLKDGNLELQQFELTSDYSTGIKVSGQGRLWPKMMLYADAEFQGFNFAVSSEKKDKNYQLSIAQKDLHFSAEVSNTFVLNSFNLLGAVKETINGFDLDLISDLYWNSESGYSGSGSLALSYANYLGNFVLNGQSALLLSGDIKNKGFDSKIELKLGANLSPDIEGFMSAEANGSLINMDSDMALWVDALISGTIIKPIVSAELRTNELGLKGELSFDKIGKFKLANNSLKIVGGFDKKGFNAVVETAGLEIEKYLTQLKKPKLYGGLRIEKDWLEPIQMKSENMRVVLDNSLIGVDIGLNTASKIVLESNLDLSDIQIANLKLNGSITGPLTISFDKTDIADATIDGTLKLSDMAFAEDALLGGSINFSGPLLSPSLVAKLEGGGSASGEMSIVYQAAEGSFELESNLAVSELKTNFKISYDSSGYFAQGGMNLAEYGLNFSRSDAFKLLLSGEGRLQDWQVLLNAETEKMTISGDLSSLNPLLSGRVNIGGDWSQDAQYWLDGTISDIFINGVDLADADLSLAHGDKKLSIIGDKIRAGAFLTKPYNFSVEELSATLNDNYTLLLSGQGDWKQSEFSLVINGDYAEQEFQIPLSLRYEQAMFYLDSQANLFRGKLKLSAIASESDGWKGNLSLDSLKLFGADISYGADILGDFIDPTLSGNFNLLRDKARLDGALQVSRFEILVDQVFQYHNLKNPLSFQGELWPELDVKVFNKQSALDLLIDDSLLTARGGLELNLGPTNIQLESSEQRFLNIDLNFPSFEGLSFNTSLEKTRLEDMIVNISQNGLVFSGQNKTEGKIELLLKDKIELDIQDFSYVNSFATMTMSGHFSEGEIWQGQANARIVRKTDSYWLPKVKTIYINLVGDSDYRFSLDSEDIRFEMAMDADFNAVIKTDDLSANASQIDLKFNRYRGFSGLIDFNNLLLFSDGYDQGILEASVGLGQGLLTSTGNIEISGQRIDFESSWSLEDILPDFLNPISAESKQLSLRIDAVELQKLPFLRNRAPNLIAPISGVVRLQDGAYIGSLASNGISVLDNEMPLNISFNGDLNQLELSGQLGKTAISGVLYRDRMDLLLRLEQFPLESIAEAIVGDTAVNSSVSGILRVQTPFDDLQKADIRFASEQIVLEQNGVESRGRLNLSYQNEDLEITNTEFIGAGHWLANGKLSAKEMSLNMVAEDADFSALIALIPQLSRFDVGASGSFNLQSSGTLASPRLVFDSDSMQISVANTKYELQKTAIILDNNQLNASATLTALSPVQGQLQLVASSSLTLLPWRLDDFKLHFAGDSALLTIGELKQISGTIQTKTGESWKIEALGKLTNELRLTGSLKPFKLNLKGYNLKIVAPRYYLASADLDADIDLKYDKGLWIGGGITINEAFLTIAGREKVDKEAPSRALNYIYFDNFKLKAAQKTLLNEAFGNAELSFDALLSGTAAKPSLRGEAHSIRGELRFSGRSFIIDESQAIFRRSRGIYPLLNIKAHSSLTKDTIIRGVSDQLTIVEPKTDLVDLRLVLEGEVKPPSGDGKAFIVDLEPKLSSNVIIQDKTYNNTRKLNDSELYSLLTLGKIELSSDIAGSGSVAETALQGAIDTAIDVLILSELQKQLGDAIGVEFFEIKTTPLSAILDGKQRFGVSLGIGAYLDDDVFASYRFISEGLSDDLAFVNEFGLRYELPPLSFDLRGSVNFLRDEYLTPAPELSFEMGYAFNDLTSIDLGVNLSERKQSIHFGVSIRW